MIHRDDRLALLEAALRGRLSRRDLMRRGGALGRGAAGGAGLLRGLAAAARRRGSAKPNGRVRISARSVLVLRCPLAGRRRRPPDHTPPMRRSEPGR